MASPVPKPLISSVLPIAEWLSTYKKSDLPGDMLAGVIVAIMLVPQGMAYAMLAGLPPEVGLYASIVPLIAYAAFGSSKVLAVGPVAMVSLLTLSSISAYASRGTSEFIALALLLALLAGIIQLVLGVARLGFFVNFLSHPVLVGFTSAAAIVIGVSQLKHIFGINVSRTEQPYQAIGEIIAALPGTNFATLTIGGLSIGLLIYFRSFLAKQLSRLRVPENMAASIGKSGALVVVLAGTGIVWLLGLDLTSSVKIVGSIPTGLPPLTMPDLNLADVGGLLPAAMIISLVGFTESISIATTLASRRRQKINANQELIALGTANIAASFTGGYPVTGGLSRSAVNAGSGANTPLASIITAVLIAVTVLFLTPLFYFLPQAVLGAIVVVAVAGLFDFRSFVHIWRYSKTDAIALLATFFGVLIFNIEIGIGIGVGTALVLHLYRTSKPHVAVVGRVGETEHFRNINRHKVNICPATHAVRIDESLYFANARSLENTLLNSAAENRELKNIVLICSAVNQIDSSALETLERVIDELRSAGVGLFLAEVKGPVMDRLRKIGFIERFGEENVFLSTHLAFEHLGCGNGKNYE